MDWTNPRVVGYLPHIIQEIDPRSAIDQIEEKYISRLTVSNLSKMLTVPTSSNTRATGQ